MVAMEEEKTIQMQIGARIRRRRMELGMNQKTVCDESGLTQRFLSRVENGQFSNIPPEKLCKLANALKSSIDFIFGRTNDREMVDLFKDVE